jgi:hypothetical protein
LSIDVFDGWGKERALEILEKCAECVAKPALRGDRRGGHLKNSKSYEFKGAETKHISINWRTAGRLVDATVNAQSVSGERYPVDGIEGVIVDDSTPVGHQGKNGNAGIRTGVNRNASLKPAENRILRLFIRDEKAFRAVLAWYTGRLAPSSDLNVSQDQPEYSPPTANPGGPPQHSTEAERGLSLEALLARLAANAETGRLGELLAVADEERRLLKLGCPDPKGHVEHTALNRVDAGFDVESNWNGERRCIEVKTSTTDGDDFFISEGERAKLLALGSQAWLYRVMLRPDGSGVVVERLRDPIGRIPEACFRPVAWRVKRNAT